MYIIATTLCYNVSYLQSFCVISPFFVILSSLGTLFAALLDRVQTLVKGNGSLHCLQFFSVSLMHVSPVLDDVISFGVFSLGCELVVGTNAIQYCVPRTEITLFCSVVVNFRNSI